MGLPAADGLAVLYMLADEWMWRRDVLSVLGAKDPGRLDTLLGQSDTPRDRGGRLAQVAAMGGEIA